MREPQQCDLADWLYSEWKVEGPRGTGPSTFNTRDPTVDGTRHGY